MGRRRKDVAASEGPQPGLFRKMLKLRPESHPLLQQVAAFRNESFQDCLHNLLVEEIARRAEEMKAWIDTMAHMGTAPKE